MWVFIIFLISFKEKQSMQFEREPFKSKQVLAWKKERGDSTEL